MTHLHLNSIPDHLAYFEFQGNGMMGNNAAAAVAVPQEGNNMVEGQNILIITPSKRLEGLKPFSELVMRLQRDPTFGALLQQLA
jgi:hypothetical protein